MALGGFALFTTLTVVGYGTFGLHPEWIGDSTVARAIFPISFSLFARLQIVLAALALAVVLVRTSGATWVPALVAVSLVSFLAEHAGTGVGVPFGEYRYTGLLGPKLGGRVPALVPLSWFLMAVPSFAFAGAAVGYDGARWIRISLGAGFLVAWDLALDPAMSFLTPYWVWEGSGPYYGMPWTNLGGWLVTSAAIMGTLEGTRSHRWIRRISLRWHGAFYGTVLAMPLGMVLVAGEWTAVAATLAGVGACVLAARVAAPGKASTPAAATLTST